MTTEGPDAAQSCEPVQAEEPKPRGKPFSKGDDARRNKGGVSKEAREAKALMEEQAPELVAELIRRALDGNMQALIRCTEYVLGKPKERLELTGADGGPIASTSTVQVHANADLPRLDWAAATAALLSRVGLIALPRGAARALPADAAAAEPLHPTEPETSGPKT